MTSGRGDRTIELRITYNPGSTFGRNIGADFTVGKYALIKGRVNAGTQGFKIDLQDSKTGDIMFHCSTRFNENKLVTNSRINNVWGVEEILVTNLPLGPEGRFEMKIINDGDCFSVFFNGEKLCTYNHRQPASNIDSFLVDGDTNFDSIEY